MVTPSEGDAILELAEYLLQIAYLANSTSIEQIAVQCVQGRRFVSFHTGLKHQQRAALY